MYNIVFPFHNPTIAYDGNVKDMNIDYTHASRVVDICKSKRYTRLMEASLVIDTSTRVST